MATWRIRSKTGSESGLSHDVQRKFIAVGESSFPRVLSEKRFQRALSNVWHTFIADSRCESNAGDEERFQTNTYALQREVNARRKGL